MVEILKIDGTSIFSVPMHIATIIKNTMIASIDAKKITQKDRNLIFKYLNNNETKNNLSESELIISSGYIDNDQESGGYIEYIIITSEDISDINAANEYVSDILLKFNIKQIKSGSF